MGIGEKSRIPGHKVAGQPGLLPHVIEHRMAHHSGMASLGEAAQHSFSQEITMPIRQHGLPLSAALALALCCASPGFTAAQTTFPERTVRIVVPAPPGPLLDAIPRMVAEKLSSRWGKPVVIENRPGAAS